MRIPNLLNPHSVLLDEAKSNGLIEFISFLSDGYHIKLNLSKELWPSNLLEDINFLELVDTKAKVHFVRIDRDYSSSGWSFNGSKWVEFISSVKHLDPKIIHFDQIDGNRFLVNFYTKNGDEVEYRFTCDHVEKCVVVECTLTPIPHKMLLNYKVNRDAKRVPIEFMWERLLMFSATKVFIISSNENGDLFVGKVMDGFVSDSMKKFCFAPCESSNIGGGSKRVLLLSLVCVLTGMGIWDVSEGKFDGLKGKKPKTVDNEECESSKQDSKKGDGRKVVNEKISKTATAATSMKTVFLQKIKEIKMLDEKTYEWLVERNPNSWCRAYFEMDICSAAFENGISKSFNSRILGARGKPIITMLEDIRVYLMQRMWRMNKLDFDNKDSITPSVRRQMENNK
ncbi:hypothetical protein Tco_0489581 [Tanacetum coccineum]